MGSEVGSVATRHQRRVPHHVLRSTQTMRAGVVDVLAVVDADEIRHFRHVVRAAVETREGAGRDAAEERPCLSLRHRFHAVVDVVADPGHGELAPVRDRERIAGEEERGAASGQLAEHSVQRHIERSTVQERAVRHDPRVTAAAVGDAERQAFGRRHPPQTEDPAVLLGLSPAARELLRRPRHCDDLRIGAPEGGDVHLFEDASAAVDPVGFSPRARSNERLGLPGPQHLPVARGFPSREVHRVGSYPLRFGCGVVLTFGKVRGPDVESGNRRRPLRQFTIVPEPWRLTSRSARLGGHADQPNQRHQCEHSKLHGAVIHDGFTTASGTRRCRLHPVA